jgi:hypothetical protein
MTQRSILVESNQDIVVQASVVSTGSGYGLTLKSKRNINLNATQRIQTNGGDVVLWSDSDSTDGGVIRLLGDSEICTVSGTTGPSGDCSTTTSGGGDVVLGGGGEDPNDSFRPGGFAAGYGTGSSVADNSGVQIGNLLTDNAGSRIYSAGGLISIRGTTTGASTATYVHGVVTLANTVINSGNGKIFIEGAARFANTTQVRPVAFSVKASPSNDTKLVSTSTSATAVVIRSYGVNGQNGHGGLGFGEKVVVDVDGGLVIEADRIVNGMRFLFDVAGPIAIRPFGTTLLTSSTNTSVFEFAFGTGGGFSQNPSSIVVGSSTNTSPITISSNLQTTSGNVELLTSGSIAKTTATLTAGGEVVINSSGSTSTVSTGTGAISAATVRLSSASTMTSGAPITSRGTIEISSSGGNTTVSGVNTAAGAISVVGGDVAISAAQSTTNNANITISPRAAYSGAGTLNSAGSLSINGGTTITPGGNLTAAGELVISGASSTLTTGSSTISATIVRLSASGNITVGSSGNGPITAGNSVSVEALSAATTTLNSNITSGSGGILVKSTGRITTAAGGSASSPRQFRTASGPITFWTTGAAGGVAFGNFAELDTTLNSSSGADITIGGGASNDAGTRPIGYATSSSSNAVDIGTASGTNIFVVRSGTGH